MVLPRGVAGDLQLAVDDAERYGHQVARLQRFEPEPGAGRDQDFSKRWNQERAMSRNLQESTGSMAPAGAQGPNQSAGRARPPGARRGRST